MEVLNNQRVRKLIPKNYISILRIIKQYNCFESATNRRKQRQKLACTTSSHNQFLGPSRNSDTNIRGINQLVGVDIVHSSHLEHNLIQSRLDLQEKLPWQSKV